MCVCVCVFGVALVVNKVIYSCVCTLLALQTLAESSPHEVVRSQARGALWILEGKEQKTPTGTTSDEASTPAGSFIHSLIHLVHIVHLSCLNGKIED